MKITINELKKIIGEAVSEARVIFEAKKKKAKKDEPEKKEVDVRPKEYSYAEAFDFSAPLGEDNLYKKQGASNMGPYTAESEHVCDGVGKQVDFLHGAIKESIIPEKSVWDGLMINEEKGAWAEASHVVRK